MEMSIKENQAAILFKEGNIFYELWLENQIML